MTKKELILFPAIGVIFIFIVAAFFLPKPWSTIQGYFEDPFSTPKCGPELAALEKRLTAEVSPSSETATSVPVLVYHGLAVDTPRSDDITFCDFKDHLMTLKANGYQTVSLNDFYLFIQGQKELPDKSFLLTFDDGQKTSYYLTDSLLKKLDYTAVMFIITKHSLAEGSSYYLSFEEIQQMMRTGRWEMQSHGKESHQYVTINPEGESGHYLSNKLWLAQENRTESDSEYLERIRRDFIESKSAIEQKLGIQVIAFAFPFGDFGQGTVNLPQAQDYIQQEIVSVYELGNFFQVYPSTGYTFNYPDPSSFMIKRIKVPTDEGGAALRRTLQQGHDKPLPFTDKFDTAKGWVPIWGEIVHEDGIMFKSDAGSPGSAAFLDGSYLWEDYTFTAQIQSTTSGNFGLIARYVDKSNFVTCNFSGDSVRIDQRLNDRTVTLNRQRLDRPLPSTDLQAAIQVSGTNTTCLLDGSTVVTTAELSPVLRSGGIGFRAFDPNALGASVQVDQVNVESAALLR